jgi:hypothetical protein
VNQQPKNAAQERQKLPELKEPEPAKWTYSILS